MGDPNVKTYRVGVIGFAHMHVNELLDRFIATGRADIVACADTQPRTPSTITVEGSRRANMQRALASPGGPRGYENYQEMLAAEKLDIAILCPENARHAEVAEAAAAHRVHMVTEKPMAASLEQAMRMASAAEKAGVALAVNWPITGSPAIRRLKELLDAGAIGDVWELKWRNGASLGPLALGSTHPGATVISGEVIGRREGHGMVASGGGGRWRSARLLLLWRVPRLLAAADAAASGTVPDGEPVERLWQRRRQCGDAAALPEGDRDPGGELDHFSQRGPQRPDPLWDEGDDRRRRSDILVYSERGATAPSVVEKGVPLPRGPRDDRRGIPPSSRDRRSPASDARLSVNLAAMAIFDAGIRSAEKGAAAGRARRAAMTACRQRSGPVSKIRETSRCQKSASESSVAGTSPARVISLRSQASPDFELRGVQSRTATACDPLVARYGGKIFADLAPF